MPRIPIDDLADPRLDPYRSLKRTNATRWRQTFVLEGEKLVRRALASGYPLLSLVAEARCLDAKDLVIPQLTPVYVLAHQDIERLIGFNFHRGLLALAQRRPPANIAELCSAPGPLRLTIAAGVQDPENLGSLARSSAAFGLAGLALAGECADPLSRRCLRVSMGATLSLPTASVATPAEAIAALSAAGVESWATSLDPSATPLDELRRPERLALVFGNEGHGLDAAWPKLCDRRVTIPMPPSVDSLNVAVAAGVFFYHIQRGRDRSDR